jgi:small GTP-binding protein
MASLEAKIVVLGSQGVGKTSLVHRYVDSSFRPQIDPPSTIGASFLTKRVLDTDTDTVVRLQIWDTAGQERFRSISRLYYRGANACILCYSITDEESFREMGRWLTDLRKELGEQVVLHVVGTKADLVAQDPQRRAVPFERCIAYVAENLYPALSSTPPATATPGGISSSESSAALGYRQFLPTNGLTLEGARSPSSKRSSGFWGQDVGWDCCHEISAETGEGVEEVFRVVTRKLVEQHRKAMESPAGTTVGGTTPGIDGEGNGYFEGANGRGSFRVGRDRRSWLGFPPGVVIDEAVEQGRAVDGRKMKWKKCC